MAGRPKDPNAVRYMPEYRAWIDMRGRCHNPNHQSYVYYGERGISVCEEWMNNFQAFFEHVGPRPKGLTLDRIDNDKGYEPGNVRWATRAQQVQNRGAYRAYGWRVCRESSP